MSLIIPQFKLYRQGRIIPFRPYPYQEDILTLLHSGSNVICLKARQMGISSLLKLYALETAINHPNSAIAFLGFRATISNEIKSIYSIYQRFLQEMQFDSIIKDVEDFPNFLERRSCIEFENGSLIKMFATNQDLKGYSITHVIVDEYNAGLNEILSSHSRCQFIINSSVYSDDNSVIKMFKRIKGGRSSSLESTFHSITIPWYLHPELTPEWEQKKRKELEDERFDREYCCKIPEHDV